MREKLIELLNDMSVDEQYIIFCEYCDKARYYDDRPECVGSIDELCCGMKPTDIISQYEDLNLSWDYFYFNGYGNVEEWEGIESNSSIEEVVDFIIDNDEDLYNDDIREILDDEE